MGTTRGTSRHTYHRRGGGVSRWPLRGRATTSARSLPRRAGVVCTLVLAPVFAVVDGSPLAARGPIGGAPTAGTVAAVALAVRHTPAPAPTAEGNGWVADDSINAQVQVGTPRSSSAACTWRVVTGVDPVSRNFREEPVTRTVDGQRETLHQRTCPRRTGSPDAEGGADSTDSWYRWVRDSTKQRIVDRATDSVSDRIKALAFRTAPERDAMVVNVGTWFWVPKVLWKPLQVTAYIETPVGVLSVTVRATPSRLRWEPGNGDDSVWCHGPGTPWVAAHGDAEASDCMYTYLHASSTVRGGRFPARTTVEWTIKVSSNFGVSFPLPSIRIGVSTPATVREIQAIID